MNITETTTIAEIATALPSSVRVFQRRGIDFCCGGRKPIGVVCEEQGLSFEELAGPAARGTGAAHGVTNGRPMAGAVTQKVLLGPKHPERICWGCDRYCPADDLACGNGTIRTPHPCELFGEDWLEWEAGKPAASSPEQP